MIAKERTDPTQGEYLRRWFDNKVLPVFARRTMPFDLAAARILATCRVSGQSPYDDDVDRGRRPAEERRSSNERGARRGQPRAVCACPDTHDGP